MKSIKLYLFASLSLFAVSLSAQNFSDALRYSFVEPIGTARFMGTGSSLSPLGADFSVLSTNPAGIAWMRKSEFVVTPGVALTKISSDLTNTGDRSNYEDSKIQFTMPNIGFVAHSRGGSSVEAFNFGMGLNRLADFNQQFFYSGKTKGSIVQRFEELANANGLDEFESGVAFDAEAIYRLQNGNYVSDFSDLQTAESTKEQSIVRSGSLSELVFGFGVNHDNKLLWGMSLGVPLLAYEEEKRYTEKDEDNEVPIYDDLAFNEYLEATGAGINLKLGFIYRVHQALRLSAAIHTPTYYAISEQFNTSMVYNYTQEGVASQGTASSPEGRFDYSLLTPWRFQGGVGTVFGKSGFLSAEVEYVNYAGNQFLYDGSAEAETVANRGIDENLNDALKFKVGGEFVSGSFRARAGLSAQQAAIVGDDNFYTGFSLGVGLRQRGYYIDLGYRRENSEETYTPYQVTNGTQQFVNNDYIRENIALTFGFKW